MLKAAGFGAAENGLWPWLSFYKKTEEGVLENSAYLLGHIVESLDVVTNSPGRRFAISSCANVRFRAMANLCWQRFADVYNAELANNHRQSFTAVW